MPYKLLGQPQAVLPGLTPELSGWVFAVLWGRGGGTNQNLVFILPNLIKLQSLIVYNPVLLSAIWHLKSLTFWVTDLPPTNLALRILLSSHIWPFSILLIPIRSSSFLFPSYQFYPPYFIISSPILSYMVLFWIMPFNPLLSGTFLSVLSLHILYYPFIFCHIPSYSQSYHVVRASIYSSDVRGGQPASQKLNHRAVFCQFGG